MNFFNITKEGKNIDNIIKYLIDFIPKNSVFFIIIDNDPYILQYNISDGYKLLKKKYYEIKFDEIDYILAQSPYIRRKYPTLKPSLVKTEDLLNADSVRAQLPTLSASYQTDPGLGLWDVWQDPEGTPDLRYYTLVDLDEECEAANPWDALQKGSAVAIDFGTSSTVAAVRESDGNIRLLRIGGDLTTKDSPTQYENPTALEFSDYKAFLKPWKKALSGNRSSFPIRPKTNWPKRPIAALKTSKHGPGTDLGKPPYFWKMNSRIPLPLS